MSEVDITSETNPDQNSRWIRKMTTAPSIKGHALKFEHGGAWCSCGFYCGGLDRVINEPWHHLATDRHDLHRVIINHRSS